MLPDKQTILLVHYYRRPREVMKEFLEEKGYAVTEARNKTEAEKYLKGHTPDIIILDSKWPNETHLSMCRHLRAMDGQSHLILIRHRAREEEVEYERNVGISAHLFDPFTQDDLLKALLPAGRALKYALA